MEILNILVVDDEYGMRRGAERALRDIVLHLPDINGEVRFAIKTAADGKELEEKMASGQTDILLLDHKLPDTTGLEILDRIGQDSVAIYYDVGNSTRMGYDVPAEIRLLKDRIAMFHFKDGPNYLGEGVVKYEPIAAAIKDIACQGWIVMETSNPSKDGVADAKRNAAYIRKLFGMGTGNS